MERQLCQGKPTGSLHTCCLPRPYSGNPGIVSLAPEKPQEGGNESAVLHYLKTCQKNEDCCTPHAGAKATGKMSTS